MHNIQFLENSRFLSESMPCSYLNFAGIVLISIEVLFKLEKIISILGHISLNTFTSPLRKKKNACFEEEFMWLMSQLRIF